MRQGTSSKGEKMLEDSFPLPFDGWAIAHTPSKQTDPTSIWKKMKECSTQTDRLEVTAVRPMRACAFPRIDYTTAASMSLFGESSCQLYERASAWYTLGPQPGF
jgi:hypothetical protein